MMTSAVQCIIILACTAILTSSGAKVICCLNKTKTVRVPFSHIVSATEYPPSPYCNNKEVIITLKNGRRVSLDPNERYTKAVLKWLKARDAAKNTIASKATTAPETQTAS
ncbi:interleukin-8b.1 [Larimichthys crocea]|uniref:Uncharacterized protein n=2 Tax=Larimichthys crocea TaxID=215358 RepID=A0ACD3Q4T3_LARCR|nr:growth-regulated alpha protein [Larimichthys crocea]TMS02175.1 C-X-C motif chemokine 3 [Larimichthys crocea]TMS02214.1 C-X-C motif chemokine 3 [Larimichthys crocea]